MKGGASTCAWLSYLIFIPHDENFSFLIDAVSAAIGDDLVSHYAVSVPIDPNPVSGPGVVVALAPDVIGPTLNEVCGHKKPKKPKEY